MKPVRTTVFLALLMTLAVDVHADAADDLRHLLVGRTVVFKMEMPLVKGVVVSPGGQLDQKLYAKRTKKHRPVFTPGERGEITRVVVDENELKICFNGCGIKFLPPGSRVVGKLDKHGSALIVDFPSEVTREAAAPALIVPLLAGIATVEGLDLARLMEPEAPEDLVPAGEQSVANHELDEQSLELLSVTVEPAEAIAGDTLRLVLQFAVSGAGPGIPITEERQIYRGETSLLESPLNTTQSYVDGRHRTEVQFRVPANAESGAYTLEGVLRGAGSEARGRAIFLVQD